MLVDSHCHLDFPDFASELDAIVARINADLANGLGNLAQRSLSMIAKQLGGVVPEPGEFSDNDKAMLAQADAMI